MSTSHIALYVGAPIEHESERAVLVELVRLLEDRGKPATILINVNVGSRQLDLVVGTDDLTLVLEAKASSAPLRGTVNGAWAALTRSGRWRAARNAYLQAVQAKNALRDAMREHQGEVTGYPSACVVFAPRLVAGSDIPADDFKVSFRGLDSLADQLGQRSQLCWTPEQWRAFAERHILDRVVDIATACDRRMLEAERTLEKYVGEVIRTYAPAAAQFKSDTYRVDGQLRGASDLERLLIQDRSDLLIQGPSGCGKSLLAIWLASRLSAVGVIPIFVECRTFDGQLGVALDREAALMDVQSAGRLFAAARMLSRPVAVIVDGYNECPADARFRLTRALRAASAKYDVTIVVSSQIDLDRADLLPLRQVSVSAPTQELKVSIASLEAPSVEALAPLLQVITTGIEASLIGRMGREVLPTTSRFALFDTFVRRRLGGAASEGVILLCAIAEMLFQRATFSLSVREVDRILAKIKLSAGILATVRDAGVLIARADRISFVHEMYLNAFAAEAIVRQQGSDAGAMLDALAMPRFEGLRTFIVGAIEDESLLAHLVGATKDALLLDACMSGECGGTAQRLVNDALGVTVGRLHSEVDRVRFDLSPPQMWDVEPAPDSLTVWTEHERALLSVLSTAMLEGHWNREMLDVVGQLDQKLADEFERLHTEAKEKGVKRLRTGLFAVSYLFGRRELGIAHTMSLLHSGGGFNRRSRVSHQNGMLRHVWSQVVTPGQLYLALALSRPRLTLEREVVEQAIECTLPFLDNRRWKFLPYHLQLDLMNFVHFLPRGDSPVRERLSQVLEALLPHLHPLLQGIAVEALTNLGVMDDEVAHHEAQVRKEVEEILRNPTGEEAAATAWGLFNAQFDHPFDIAYIDVIQNLTNEQRLTLLRLACTGASDSSFFLSSAINELAEAGDALAVPAIARWARLPSHQSTMPQQSVEIFVTALIGLGKLGFDLPDEVCRLGQGPREDAMSACGLLYYWLQRRAPEAAVVERQVLAALDTLCAEPAVSIGVLFDISRSIWDTKGRGTLLVQAFPERMVAIARDALQHRGPLEGYFPGCHFTDPDGALRFAVSLLDTYGSAADLSLLRTFVDDVRLAGVAREALMSIEARSGLPAAGCS
jgi:hypothetical protein